VKLLAFLKHHCNIVENMGIDDELIPVNEKMDL